MPMPRIFNPDDHLRAPQGRIYTEERNAAAWERMYAELDAALAAAGPEARFYIVMGVQGGGKTTWIQAHRDALGPAALVMDAAVPARRHRERALALARHAGVPAVAVWMRTPLEQALARNARRPADEVVPEFAVRSVFELLEAPTADEGFDEVIVVDGGAQGA